MMSSSMRMARLGSSPAVRGGVGVPSKGSRRDAPHGCRLLRAASIAMGSGSSFRILAHPSGRDRSAWAASVDAIATGSAATGSSPSRLMLPRASPRMAWPLTRRRFQAASTDETATASGDGATVRRPKFEAATPAGEGGFHLGGDALPDSSVDGNDAADDTPSRLEETTRRLLRAFVPPDDVDACDGRRGASPPSPPSTSHPQLHEYNRAIHAWATSIGGNARVPPQSSTDAALNAAENAQALLDHLERCHREYGVSSLRPSVVSYNAAMHAWARAAPILGRVAAENAERVLDGMIAKSWGGREGRGRGIAPPRPNTVSFNAVLDAWAKSSAADAGRNAERVLLRMEDLMGQGWKNPRDGGEDPCVPNVRSFNAVVEAWANGGDGADAEGAHRARGILDGMVRHMQEREKRRRRRRDDGVGGVIPSPNVVTFNSVIHAWCRRRSGTGTPMGGGELTAAAAAENAERVLRLLAAVGDDAHPPVRPDARTLGMVLGAHARVGTMEAVRRAESILDEMGGLVPRENEDMKGQSNGTNSVNVLLAALSMQGGSAAAERSEALLRKLQESAIPGLLPDTASFNTVMDRWAKSGDAEAPRRAEALLGEMEDLGRRDPDGRVRPDAISYTTAIDAHARSPEGGGAQRAAGLLRRLVDAHRGGGDEDTRPDAPAYTAVIIACARCRGDREERRGALRVAIRTFEELERSSHGNPNNVTYRALLTAISCLATNGGERHRLLEHAFRRCCRDGCVDGTLLRRFRNSADEGLRRKILGGTAAHGGVNIDRLPESWSRNVTIKHS